MKSFSLLGTAVLLLFQLAAAQEVPDEVVHQLSAVLKTSAAEADHIQKEELFAVPSSSMVVERGAPDRALDADGIRRRLNARRCKNAIRARCGRKCRGKCLNACYVKHMAFFNDIRTCVTGQNVLRGSAVGRGDFDRDGIKNGRDEDDDNDGIKDSDDDDDDNDNITDGQDSDDDNDGLSDGRDNDNDRYSSDGDADGIPDVVDSDDDNDGLSDSADSDDDNDGILDSDDPSDEDTGSDASGDDDDDDDSVASDDDDRRRRVLASAAQGGEARRDLLAEKQTVSNAAASTMENIHNIRRRLRVLPLIA